MNTPTATCGLTFLRPYLLNPKPLKNNRIYLRLFNTTCLRSQTHRVQLGKPTGPGAQSKVPKFYEGSHKVSPSDHDVEERVQVLSAEEALHWPRIQVSQHDMTVAEYQDRWKHLKPNQCAGEETVVVRGRVTAIRLAGTKLAFLDLVQDYMRVQIVCNLPKITFGGVTQKEFKTFLKLLQRGDIISVSGQPYRSASNELSITVSELPAVLSPTLASLPVKLEDLTTRIKHRHVDMLVNREVADRLRVRSHIIQCMRDFFIQDNFLEVQTPLIADKASGAIAKSFKTVATEFSSKELALRIAPELWLKRLVIGGMDRVFEIGPSFRNEGLDATHNPEFTTCEFYKAYADLDSLMKMTEELFTTIASKVQTLREFPLRTIPEFDQSLVAAPFNRIEFIPGIENAMGKKLPVLSAEDATEQLIELFKQHDHPLPARPTLPRLLDRLASIYIEPLCTTATFIMHHPSCMAPLAKSFVCPSTKQLVSARAELFIQSSEIANMYEEENSPFEQRSKFIQQGQFIDEENEGYVDESYLKALESALPPTGGWGAGVDRIVMLFSGTKRIADVLSFGSLRNVVHLGNTSPILEVGKDARSEVGGIEEKEKLAQQAM